MSPAIISIILWIPFILVVLISGFIFCTSGFKRGIWRALISIGVTIVSAIVSFFLGKIMAGFLSKGVIDAVLTALSSTEGISMSLVTTFVGNIVQAMLSVFLFAVIFFLLTFILKVVVNFVQIDVLDVEDDSLKLAGLGVRFVDALLYTMLFLMPLYGTLGAYVPSVQSVISMMEEEDEELTVSLVSVTSHPLVAFSSDSVFGGIYNLLSKVEMSEGGTAVSIPEIMGVMKDTVNKFEAFSSAEGEDADKACLDLIRHLKDNVVEADWSYGLIKEVTGSLKTEIVNSMGDASEEERAVIENVVGMLDMSEDEYQENGVVILDYIEYTLANNVMDALDSSDKDTLKNEEFYKETAEFLNATKQTTEIKKYLVTEVVTGVCNGDKEAVKSIMDNYDASAATTEEVQQQEVESLIAIFTATTPDEVKEGLKNIPGLDAEAIENVFVNINEN